MSTKALEDVGIMQEALNEGLHGERWGALGAEGVAISRRVQRLATR